jgi:CubicO group peptidase (beta-lactamase class C family)
VEFITGSISQQTLFEVLEVTMPGDHPKRVLHLIDRADGTLCIAHLCGMQARRRSSGGISSKATRGLASELLLAYNAMRGGLQNTSMNGHRLVAHIIHILILLALLSTTCCAQRSGDTSGLQSKLERYLDQQSDSGFGFSVLVAIDGRVVLQKGYGWIDSLKRTGATDRTLFNIASMTKSMTATAVFSLCSRNLLNLNDSLPRFFPGVPEDKRSITITQLLAHTAGFAQHYVADGVIERDSAVRYILNDTLQFVPGSGFSYSNENYELLGAIIELVTHQTYEEAMRSLVLSKATMNDTKFWAEPLTGEQDIAAMNRNLDSTVLARNWGYIGSGGIYSNVVDLYSWFTALQNGTLVDSIRLREMWTVRHQLSITRAASGWFISSADGRREIWTRGNEDWGHNGVLRWFPEHNVLIIVLTNSGERGDKNISANRFIGDGIARIIFR